MKKSLLTFFAVVFLTSQAVAALRPGETAPEFEVKDIAGKTHKLSDFKGNWVVLEWFNKGCPFIQKHYNTSNMQNLQKKYTKQGVIWLSVISSAEGKQGYESDADTEKTRIQLGASPSFILRDNRGIVGRLYDAKTTPHMFIISPEQKIAYNGAIDDKDSYEIASVKEAKNYVSQALDEALAKKPISVPSTRPYGCSVKY